MLLALMTDLHANREAVSACLAHAQQQNVSRYVFLGDLIGYGADPGWVLQTVMDHVTQGSWAIMGNHDIAVLQEDRQNMNPVARQVVEWTRDQLNTDQLDFIRKLPYRIEWQDLLFVHANAWAPDKWEYIDGVMEAMRSMHATRAAITFCGHVHLPTLYHMTLTGKTGEFLPTPENSIPLSKQRRWLVIPGSAGQPRDGNPAACYATFDTETQDLTYFRVPYDHEAAAKKILDAGLPAALASRLLTGN
ncbi:metallophosphoesterase family protein [Undibacterium oligocarboniphilum]|uniref:Metallophosphoesterase family protein n=1 Tax=Undibacterium oligocarboniphilum TaxID=666702 RepID=A0A850QGA6_9BURK|nr:metallophosphoesterase family protein [Undibacterium oligocarboniphilum]MBC3870994.1 metallophosphoesterase family protein [Undibacterium oligocarboniphilum]NVO76383.1 metallophosphoesterase family protein [Undibacterium oligocarboniphilum]